MTDLTDSQIVLGVLHDKLGMSDSDIAYVGNVTRNYINLVRHGKRTLSPQKLYHFVDIYEKLKEADYTPERIPYGTKKKRGTQKRIKHVNLTKKTMKVRATQHPTLPVTTQPRYTQPTYTNTKNSPSPSTIPSEEQTYCCSECGSINGLQSYIRYGTPSLLCKRCIARYEASICSVCGLAQETTSMQHIGENTIQICTGCATRYKRGTLRL